MKQAPALQMDLTSLFFPAMKHGPHSVADLAPLFPALQTAMADFKNQELLAYQEAPFDSKLLPSLLEAKKKYAGYKNIVVLGIGGSALGAQSIYYALKGEFSYLNRDKRLVVMDHIEPLAFLELKTHFSLSETLFVLISKSGDTSETLAQYLALKQIFPDLSNTQILVVTDEHKGYLRTFANEHNLAAWPVPSKLGGRFSVFSAVGLLPLALANIDVKSLLAGAQSFETELQNKTMTSNPAALMACALYHWYKNQNRSQVVLMPYSQRLRLLSDWFSQLLGESLGKNGVGLTPLKATGVTDQHSQLQLYLDGPLDKIIVFVGVQNYTFEAPLGTSIDQDERISFLNQSSLKALMHAELRATQEALNKNQRPHQTVWLSEINEFNLGKLYQLLMNVVPRLGGLMGLNPFDQPAVEQIKKITFGLMGRKGFEVYASDITGLQNNPLVFESDAPF